MKILPPPTAYVPVCLLFRHVRKLLITGSLYFATTCMLSFAFAPVFPICYERSELASTGIYALISVTEIK